MTQVLDVPAMSHVELFSRLGLHGLLEPITEDLMDELLERRWREDEFDSPHAHPWHTCFHASEFPGDSDDACPRALAYRMMNFLPNEPMPAWVTTTATVGSAGEDDIVRAYHQAGRLLSAGPDDPVQTYFEDPESWFGASTDATVLPPFHLKPHVVEIKGKADDVIQAMNLGERAYDPQHRHQLLASLGAAHRTHPWESVVLCEETWRLALAEPGVDFKVGTHSGTSAYCRVHGDSGNCLKQVYLEPADTGSIYYWSRSWPRGNPRLPLTKPKEFFFTLDLDFLDAGRERLKQIKQMFIDDVIPPRPGHFAWSTGACQYCKLKKKTCKPDDKAGTTKLSESAGVEHAKSIRPDYDVDLIRAAVMERWI